MIAAFITATQTLTRIPVPSLPQAPDAELLGRSAVFYPVIGIVLGLAGYGVFRLLDPFLPREIVMLLVLALWVVLTGALHEDGLADAADAFGSQRTPERILAVLKDSRIGTYGAVAIVLSLLLRWRSLTGIAAEDVLAVCVASQVIPRMGIVLLAAWAGSATEGSGGAFAAGLRWWHWIGSTLMAALLVAAVRPPVEAAVYSAAACLVIVVLAKFYFRRRLGGITGDCLGATAQFQEMAILLMFLAYSGAVA